MPFGSLGIPVVYQDNGTNLEKGINLIEELARGSGAQATR